jgi:hypothetical protein
VLFDHDFPVQGGASGLSGWPATSSLFTRTAGGLKIDSRLAGLVNARAGGRTATPSTAQQRQRPAHPDPLPLAKSPPARPRPGAICGSAWPTPDAGVSARALTARFIDGNLYAEYRNATDGTWTQVLLSSAVKLVKDNQTYIVEASASQDRGSPAQRLREGHRGRRRGSFTYTLSQNVWTSARFTMSAFGDQARSSAVMTVGRLQEIRPSAPTAAVQTLYAYDALSRLRQVVDGNGQRSHLLYDPAGRKVADIDATGRMVEYAYDAGGRWCKASSTRPA